VIRTAVLRLIALLACGAVAGAAQPRPVPIALAMQTTRLVGWLSARGTLMLNSTRKYETFNPIGKEESLRCVSIVNDTGAPSQDYAGFDGKRVTITGFVVRYEDLPLGNAVADQLLSRRYYKAEPVHDFCNRELVFVARKIELKN
jgi:hypothetical protein